MNPFGIQKARPDKHEIDTLVVLNLKEVAGEAQTRSVICWGLDGR